MGQYYEILNVDKKEMLVPWTFENGAKLMEWSYDINDMVLALSELMTAKGRWAGDRVVVCGDYADAPEGMPDSEKEVWTDAYIQIAKELGFYGKKEKSEGSDREYEVCLYAYASDNFKELNPNELEWSKTGHRYIINHAQKVFVDMKHCPIEWVWYDSKLKQAGVTKVTPLSLLLAMGNGRGGGDYSRKVSDKNADSFELVGSWTKDAGKIEVADEVPADYTEFTPNFTELEHLIPWESEAGLIAQKMNAESK